MKSLAVVLSCEHGGNEVPAAYRHLFEGAEELLASHRGHDPGTLELGQALARAFEVPLIATTVTRLLVDTNRSRGNRTLFSERSRGLGKAEKEEVLARWHEGHRQEVSDRVENLLEHSAVLHLGIHSFTPCLDGEERNFDIGWLYDSRRPEERGMADALIAALRARRPDLRQRRNAPYLGSADGLTTTLRRRFVEKPYLGLELEVNQRHPLGAPEPWKRLIEDLVAAIRGGVPDEIAGGVGVGVTGEVGSEAVQ